MVSWASRSIEVWSCPYKNDKVAQACDMVVTSLYTRNMLSTTLFPGCYNLVKPGDKLVSLHKVVTSCHKTLHKFEINCFIFFYAVAVVTRYLHVTCMFRTWCVLVWRTCMLHFWQHTCNIHVSWPVYQHATCTLCATCVLYVTCMRDAHSIRVAFWSSLQL